MSRSRADKAALSLGAVRLSSLCLAAAALAGVPALAQQSGSTSATNHVSSAGVSWNALSASQRNALAPLERDWATIDAERKSKWLEVAARFPKMPPEERERVQARMAEWARMSPTERGRARLNFQESKVYSAQEKQARWEAYQALPEERRQALAERAEGPAARASTAPLAGAEPKQNRVPSNAAPTSKARAVSPTMVQGRPGATTTLITQTPASPSHQQPGQPKIVGSPSQIDRATLLPRTGPQATSTASPAAAPTVPAPPARPLETVPVSLPAAQAASTP